MSEDKNAKFSLNSRLGTGDFSWVNFYSETNLRGAKHDEYVFRVETCNIINEIDMSGNNFYKYPKLLIDAISVVNTQVYKINLSFNQLYRLSDDDWNHFCRSIPSDIRILDLSNNKLGELDFVTFKDKISRIPCSVQEICIYNTIFNYPESELEEYISIDGNRLKLDHKITNSFKI